MVSHEREKGSVNSEGRISSTALRKQNRYLFDIVASLCAGFNEHDIEFLSSLLALLRGDLSAPVKAEGGETDEETDTERNVAERRSQKEREEMEREKQRELNTESYFWLKKRG